MIGRLIIQRRRDASDDTKAEPSNSGDTQLPNGFSDDISEIDADIDLQTSLPSGLHHNVNKHDVGLSPFLYLKFIGFNKNTAENGHNKKNLCIIQFFC